MLYKASPPLLLSSGAAALSVAPAELQALADQVAEPSIAARRYVAGYSHAYPALLQDWRVAALTKARIADRPIQAVAIKLAEPGLAAGDPLAVAAPDRAGAIADPCGERHYHNALQAIDGPGRLQIGTNWGCPRPRPGTWG